MRTRFRPHLSVGLIHLYPTCLSVATIATVLVLATMSSALHAGTDREAGTPKVLVLFDGKSLDGWKKTDFFRAGEVKVEDGSIIMSMSVGGSMTGITSTRQDLPKSNYELTYEAMRLSGRDFFAAATFPVRDSFVTLINGGWGGSVTGLSSLNGADASENETGRFFEYQNKTWYKFRVRVTDEVIRCWIDEEEILAVDHSGMQVGTRIEVRENQPLGFATWETSGAIRKIEIRPLSPAEVAATPKPD
jgi:hypothetical protein